MNFFLVNLGCTDWRMVGRKNNWHSINEIYRRSILCVKYVHGATFTSNASAETFKVSSKIQYQADFSISSS